MVKLAYVALCLGALIVLPWDIGITPGPMLRNTAKTAADEPQDTAAYTRSVVYFPCSGVKCQAWLYMPKHTEGKPPVLVGAHGVGCQKDFQLQQYGDRFAKAGFAALIFDYRTFGGSEGEPRHWASPSRHLKDYESAVAYVKSELSDRVDVNRINLWGTSLSGGHVLTLAGTSLRDSVTAVVAQVPHTDGAAFLADNIKRRPLVVVRAILAGFHDTLRSLFNYPPAYVSLTGEPGSFSVMDLSAADTKTFYSLHPQQRQGGWRNMVRAKLALEGLLYRPVKHIPNIKAPVLYLAATEDELTPLESIKAALELTPDGQLVTFKTGHFGVYSGLPFPFFMQHAVSFLRDKNGMPRLVMSSAEAAGLGRRQPEMAHKGAAHDAAAEARQETAAEL